MVCVRDFRIVLHVYESVCRVVFVVWRRMSVF